MSVLEASLKLLNLAFGGASEAIEKRALMEAKRQDITPLLLMPEGSECKAPLLERVLSCLRHFDDVYLLYSEGLEAIVNGEVVARDTKVVIDSSHPLRVHLNTNDADKFYWVLKYLAERGIESVPMFGDAKYWIRHLQPSTVRSLIYVNGAFIKAQTPELVNFLKAVLPCSTIVMVVIDPYKSQATRNPKSVAYRYGHDMSEYIRSFGTVCNYPSIFIPYGINRYLTIV